MKRFGLIAGLLALHFGYNILSFVQQPGLAVLLAVICSASLVHLCERPVEEAEKPSLGPLVLRLAVFTGYLTYGIYLWHLPRSS